MKLKKNSFLPVNLQFFGETEESEGQGDNSGGENKSDNDEGLNNGGEPPEENPEEDTSRLTKLIEDAVKRATKKMSEENKKLTKALDKLQKEKLSEDELKQLEIDNKMAEIAEREKQLAENENRLYAIKAVKAAGLDDGSENSLELIDFIMGVDKEDIDSRVKTFGDLVNKFVKAEVDRIFKENGRIPGRGAGSGNGGDENNIAAELGKRAAQANEKARSIIDSYLNR